MAFNGVKVWENSKKPWKHSPTALVRTAFLDLSNFHLRFCNSIEHVTCFLLLTYKTGEISLQGDLRRTLRANVEKYDWDCMEILPELGKLKTSVFL